MGTFTRNTPDLGAPVEIIHAVLGDTVLGVYLFGSSVDGGLKPRSDIDLLVLADRAMPDEARRELCNRLLAVSGNPAVDAARRPLEVTVITHKAVSPWRHPAQSDFVYGEWLRDFFEAGGLPRPAIDADLTVVLATALQNNRILSGPPLNTLMGKIPAGDVRQAIRESLPALLASLHGDERNVLLTLARMWHTLATGEIVPKDAAALWALGRLPAKYRPVLRLALDAYLGNCDGSWQMRGREVDVFVEYATHQINCF